MYIKVNERKLNLSRLTSQITAIMIAIPKKKMETSLLLFLIMMRYVVCIWYRTVLYY